MKAVQTGHDYVKYKDGIRKWYKAVFEKTFLRLRVSRKTFKRAAEAREYKLAVLARLERLRNGREY